MVLYSLYRTMDTGFPVLCLGLAKRTGGTMLIPGIPHDELRHTRAAQEWLAEGRQQEAASVTLRLLTRRCGPLSEATTARIQSLPLDQLEALAEALLDFQGADDLATWLAANW